MEKIVADAKARVKLSENINNGLQNCKTGVFCYQFVVLVWSLVFYVETGYFCKNAI